MTKEDGRFEKGQKAWNKGVKLNKDQRKNMGRPIGAKHTEETKKKMSLTRRGKGVSRLSWNFKEWRRKVFERDNYSCVECGCTKKENLHPHHIVPFNESLELRFEPSNGKTLCKSCHAKKEGFQKGVPSIRKGQYTQPEKRRICKMCNIEKDIEKFTLQPSAINKYRARMCKKCCNLKRSISWPMQITCL